MAAIINKFSKSLVELCEFPCPFCGSNEVGRMWKFGSLLGPMKFFIFCHACKARGPERDNPGEAVAAWNRVGTPKKIKFHKFKTEIHD